MLILKLALLLLATSIGLTYGFATSFRRFVRLEAVEDHDSVITWYEGPHRTFFLNISHGLLVTLNDLTILVMTSLLMACAIRYDGQELMLVNDTSWQIAALVIIAVQVGLTWWVAGSTIVSLVISVAKRRIRVAISPSGIRWGIAHLPWTSFSHFDSEFSPSRLCFYSAYSPDLCTISITPPESILWEQAVSIAARNLPDAKQINLKNGKRLKGRFYIENCGLCIAGLLVSIFLFRFSTLWSQFLQMAFVLLFVLASTAIIRRYVFAGASAREPSSRR